MKILPGAKAHVHAHPVHLCVQNVIFKFVYNRRAFYIGLFEGLGLCLVAVVWGGFFPSTLKQLCGVWLLPVLICRPERAGVILSENAEQKALSGMYLFLLSVCLILCPACLERYLLLCICKRRSDHKDNDEFRLIKACEIFVSEIIQNKYSLCVQVGTRC